MTLLTADSPMFYAAEKNIKMQRLINMLAGFVFLTPVVTLLYKTTGLGLVEITLIANVATLCTWLFELPTSIFADVSGLKKSLLYSVVCNFIGALVILLFPSFWGFITASFFAALYWSFWSGTGQAFLENNLRVLGKEKTFGKVIGEFMMMEQAAGLICPLIAAGILFFFKDGGYMLLALLDTIAAALLVMLTLRLKEFPSEDVSSERQQSTIRKYFTTGKEALLQVFTNKDIRTLMLFRSFGNHVAYFPLVIFPVLVDAHMPDYASGIVASLATLGMMFVLKYGNIFSEKYSYATSWVTATLTQALLLFIAAFFLQHWIVLVCLYILFVALDGLWQPAWNHVLVQVVGGKAIATTRSLVFSVFALYTTIGKQVMSWLPLQSAFITLAIIIVLANVFLGRRVLALGRK